jgi:hypothetical protein
MGVGDWAHLEGKGAEAGVPFRSRIRSPEELYQEGVSFAGNAVKRELMMYYALLARARKLRSGQQLEGFTLQGVESKASARWQGEPPRWIFSQPKKTIRYTSGGSLKDGKLRDRRRLGSCDG